MLELVKEQQHCKYTLIHRKHVKQDYEMKEISKNNFMNRQFSRLINL